MSEDVDVLAERRVVVAKALAEYFLPYQDNFAVGDLDGTVFRYIDIGEVDMLELADLALDALDEAGFA